MGYVEVAVNSPIAQRRTFSYSIPPTTSLSVGQAVWVPFGSKTIQGVVLELTEYPAVKETKEVIGLIDPHPLLSPVQIQLARWISDHYLSPLFDAVALMLPPGFERKLVTYVHRPLPCSSAVCQELTTDEELVLGRVEPGGTISPSVLEKALGQKRVRAALNGLLRHGLVTKTEQLQEVRVKPMAVSYLRLAADEEAVREAVRDLARKAPRQAALLVFLSGRQSSVPVGEAAIETGCTREVVKSLESKGLVVSESHRVLRDPLLDRWYPPGAQLTLTGEQGAALQSIEASLRHPGGSAGGVFLLHGVTGSGKTEVYLRALAEAVAVGKRGIVLVPEIALTPQTIERFAARFPRQVAVLHSKLSLGEQFDVWEQIRAGAFQVVIGARSAIFAPQPNLGIVVLDEEHEWTYKQQEASPHYHAREVAIKLAELCRATVVLGSATPDVESYHLAETGGYRLLQLTDRITPAGISPMPRVEVVDMRRELNEGNRSIFSRSLTEAIGETLAAREQGILFLNRRGTATFVQCRDCGLVLRCSGCDLPLTYHSADEKLICHQCNRRRSVPDSCPQCHSRRIRFMGTGTERVEEEVARLFPAARTMRWDRDVTRGKDSHERIARSFASREADILVGTQMIAKGLDFPQVTLAGIVSADTILHFPDFRSSERTFQLLCQVAGRAGRGIIPGRVVVQTYAPDNYAVASAARPDYLSFYRQEIAHRRRYENPPYSRLAMLVFAHASNDVCQRESDRMRQRLKERIDSEGLEIALLGPSPMFFQKVRGRFRWQLVLRGSDPAVLLAGMPLPQGWVVHIDPIGLL
ncbi:MAG: primosomal protein N' [Chloroflexi bacterium]|nr:primosomal protein N' [Chloroflexota bacterium]